MTYALREDLAQRYGSDEIAQREAALDPGALDVILADADALIDGYLASGYTLPLVPVPAKLTQVACAVARYNLLGDAVTERARNDYTDALGWLKDVQAGVVMLQVAAPEPELAPAMTVLVPSSASVFKRAGRP